MSEVWLIFHKRHTGRPSVSYEDAVDEALCYGWIDSLIKRIDDDRYARKFTPRRPASAWSTVNRRRYEALKSAKRLAPPGVRRSPTDRSGDAPQVSKVPIYIVREFKRHPRAWKFFETLPPSHKRAYVAWIDSAKRDETRRKRLGEAVVKLNAGKKPSIN
ncbi:MAG TPA: YdeI/OmpD-associated family protein [Vicinamibacterales bacterium]|nr:YdeI/OmpD-associated family protein [Vicinamibacterales bacterium]